jgi:hypothetical protein
MWPKAGSATDKEWDKLELFNIQGNGHMVNTLYMGLQIALALLQE